MADVALIYSIPIKMIVGEEHELFVCQPAQLRFQKVGRKENRTKFNISAVGRKDLQV